MSIESRVGGIARAVRRVVQRLRVVRDVPLDAAPAGDSPATLEDVYYCYRLLLQRNPDPTGWGAYADQIARGLRVRNLVGYFVGSPEWIERGLYRSHADTSLARVQTADFPLYVIACDPVVARELIATGRYEPHITDRLRERLLPGMTFVDVGANVGFYALLAAKRVGNEGRVVAFEPNPDNLKPLLLNRLINGYDHIDVRPFAVSDTDGFLCLMKIVSIASTKALGRDELEHLSDAQVVYAVTLDRALAAESRVDVLKCDIDGHDFRAMRGARATLEEHRPLVIAELNPGTLRSYSGVDAGDYLGLFFAIGYRATVLLRDGHTVACGSDPGRVLEVLGRSGADQVDLWLESTAG